jgi:hypothetical protein
MKRLPNAALLGALMCGTAASSLCGAEVILTRVAEGGLQPQAVVSKDGTVHLVQFKGEPKAGNLFYARRPAGAAEFTKTMRVNSLPDSAIALGTIRGAQMAVGKGGRIHIAWNGSGKASAHEGAPMLYTRLNNSGDAFEPERDVMTFTSSLDGGGSVAADERGNVYVAWHGNASEKPQTEADRAVFVAVSTNEGKTFMRERQANPEPTGACGCCGMKAFADANGVLYLLYREARGGVERSATILASEDQARTFRSLHTHPWKVATCPMSSAWLGTGTTQTLAAWETMGQVWFAAIDPRSGEIGKPTAPGDTGKQKHPVAVSNAKGETLLVWTKGTGWMKGGAVAWQLFDREGKPTETKGCTDGVPVWSFATALTRRDGSFEIIY